MIRADDVPLLTAETTSLRGSVAPLLLFSAMCHVGAVAWALSGNPGREIDAHAGSAVAMTVTIVTGPEAASPVPSSAQPDRNARTGLPRPISEPAQPASETPEPPPRKERMRSEDRKTDGDAKPAFMDAPDLPASTIAAPIPPPRPAIPDTAIAAAIASEPAHIMQIARPENGSHARETTTALGASSRSGPLDGLFGKTRGAAPRANNPAPSYPPAARRRGQEGRVLLNVEVTPEGTPSRVTLETSSGHTALDRAALDTVRRWRFRPATKNGKPLKATVQVPIRFALK